MLFWHKHNFEKALADLPNFTPFPYEWTVEDKVLFEQAFNFHGKSFHRIRQMVGLTATTAFVMRNAVHIVVLFIVLVKENWGRIVGTSLCCVAYCMCT